MKNLITTFNYKVLVQSSGYMKLTSDARWSVMNIRKRLRVTKTTTATRERFHFASKQSSLDNIIFLMKLKYYNVRVSVWTFVIFRRYGLTCKIVF